MENYKTFQNILDGILLKCRESAQDFPEEERIVAVNEEYLYLQRIIDRYNPGTEWTSQDTDTNYVDITMNANVSKVPHDKTGVIRRVEYRIDGESNWHEVDRTSAKTYTGLSLSDALERKAHPTQYISRMGSIQLVGKIDSNYTVRIYVADDVTLLSASNKTAEPRLPMFARTLLVLSPTIEYMDEEESQTVKKHEERYFTVMREFVLWAKGGAPKRRYRNKSKRRI